MKASRTSARSATSSRFRPGYARNYLLPKGLAVQPTPNNVKKIEARRKEIERQERERREQQEALIKQLEGVEVTLERKANEQGHLFGSVSATDIAKGLQTQGFNINPDDVNLPGKLDRIDTYTVKIRFADDLTTDVKVWVAPDPRAKRDRRGRQGQSRRAAAGEQFRETAKISRQSTV